MTLLISLKIIQTIIALAVFLQTLEYLSLKDTFTGNGVWRWGEIKKEFLFLPNIIQQFFNFFLMDRHFIFLLWIRLLVSVLFIFYSSFFFTFFLFLSSLLVAQRFRGSFNGGSDYMSLIILSALCVQTMAPSFVITKGVLWYIAIQSATSYFIAGIIKLKLSSWRNGVALTQFIQSPNYGPPTLIRRLLSQKQLAFLAAWVVIIFEITFPFILVQHNGNIIFIWLLLGFLFHLSNVFIFGLNRFLIVWLATYPAIYFCALK